MTERCWDVEAYPLWHGMAQMSQIAAWGGPGKQLVAGDGCWVQDADGRRYLDGRSGICNMNLGYGRRDIADAIYQQALAVPFACVIRFDRQAPVTLDYARELVDAAPEDLSRVRLTHMGSASVENAVLMARRYFQNVNQQDRRRIVALRGSFHGTTYLSMTASGERELHQTFGPMAVDFSFAPPPWADPDEPSVVRTPGEALAEMRELVDREGPERVAAIMVEPVMGSEVVPLGDTYLRGLRQLCDETGILLIFDEIVTAFGRTGHLFAAEGAGVTPDIMCLAKGITAGYAPMGAVLVREHVFQRFDSPYRFFPNGSSTDGHPVCCAAALAALRAYRNEDVIENGRAQGERLLQSAVKRLGSHPLVRDVRGQGLLIGAEIDDGTGRKAGLPAMREIRQRAESRGVLVQQSKSTIIAMPPLIITDDEAEFLLEALEYALDMPPAT